MNNHLKTLKEDGFVILDVLNSEEINYLNKLCEKFLTTKQNDFIAGSHFLAKADSDFINQELQKILKDKIHNWLPELVLMGGTLATKITGKSVLKAHNDWDIVDEKKYNSYNLWLALVDTNSKNGTLGIIPNSHLWQHEHRGMNISSNFESFTNQFLKIGIEPNLKAGQAILYNHKLVHYSKPNTTKQPRNVAIIGMRDKESDLQVSFTLDKKNIETYAVEESDFYPFEPEKIKANRKLIATKEERSLYNNWNEVLEEYQKNINDRYRIKTNFLATIKAKIYSFILR